MPRAKIKVDIRIPMYRARIEVYIGSGADVYRGWPIGITKEKPTFEYLAMTWRLDPDDYKSPRQGFNYLIHAKEFNIGLIAHESVHVASFLFGKLGIDADHDNDEAFAYLVQYIVECVSKKMK